MKPAVAAALAPNLAERLKRRILHDCFVRLHMSLILTAVVVSGVLTSKGLLEMGVLSLRFRYVSAVLGSYLMFLLLVRVWIWYVARRHAAALNFDPGCFDFPGGGSGGGGSAAPFRFGGGDSGGGGASSFWEGDADAEPAPPAPVSTASGGHWISVPDINLDLDDDSWWILLILAVLVIAIFCAGGYLIYAAPQILPEAACQTLLASTLARVSKDDHHGWMRGVIRSTVIPFAIVVILAGTLGWAAHRHCPQAAKLMDALQCGGVR